MFQTIQQGTRANNPQLSWWFLPFCVTFSCKWISQNWSCNTLHGSWTFIMLCSSEHVNPPVLTSFLFAEC
uniref:Uncharacterized protein n=1 Tax=Arundo donax TaxID=35708 RepID=A0A0A9TQ64_ARUDO